MTAILVAWAAAMPGRAAAQVVLSAEVPAAVPVSQPQSHRFGVGGMPSIGAYLRPVPGLLAGVRGRVGALTDADWMEPDLADPGAGGLASGTVAIRIRPGHWLGADRLGLFAEAAGGVGVTGHAMRPTYELAIGWRFELGRISAGPSARYVYVHQSSDPIDDRAAHLALIGIDLGFARPRGRILEGDSHLPEIVRPTGRKGDRHPPARPPAIALDHDRIVDQDRPCPVRAPQDDAGCSLPHDLVVTGDRIILDERVLFDDNRARVKHRAWPVLESIVAAWHGRPDWRAIRIEGHADARGPSDYNAWLSEERARRVRDKLIELGMPSTALSIQGYGESRLRSDGMTPEAHQRNRRVEFVITTGPPRSQPPGEE